MKHKIYVASSWRNQYYSKIVAKLREAGHDVYDFRNPPLGDPGFSLVAVVPTRRLDGLRERGKSPSLISQSDRSQN